MGYSSPRPARTAERHWPRTGPGTPASHSSGCHSALWRCNCLAHLAADIRKIGLMRAWTCTWFKMSGDSKMYVSKPQ